MSGFLDIEDVVNLLGISSSMVHRNRRAGKYVVQQVESKGGKDGLKYQIALTSLPIEAQNRHREAIFSQQIAAISAPVIEADSSPKTALISSPTGQKLQVEKRNNKAVLASENAPTDLSLCTDRQREIDRSIKVIFAFIEGFGGTELAAIRHVNMRVITGDLPKELLYALDHDSL